MSMTFSGLVSVMIGGQRVGVHRHEMEFVEFPINGATPLYSRGYKVDCGQFHADVDQELATVYQIAAARARVAVELKHLYTEKELTVIEGGRCATAE